MPLTAQLHLKVCNSFDECFDAVALVKSITAYHLKNTNTNRWSKIIVGQVDLTAKLCLSFCLELQSAKSTYQHVDLDLY